MKGDRMDRLTYRVNETAEGIGHFSGETYQLIASGKFRALKIGGCKRVPVSGLKVNRPSSR